MAAGFVFTRMPQGLQNKNPALLPEESKAENGARMGVRRRTEAFL